MSFEIFNEDCISGMSKLADGSVDSIICDPPFQSTDCAWDKRIPIDEMWEQFNRVTKQNAAIVLFAQLPFAVDLINANRKMFRYEWIWSKPKACGFLNANRMPLRAHENILVFYRALPTYNPQWSTGKPYTRAQRKEPRTRTSVYQGRGSSVTQNDGNHYYPRDVITFSPPVTNSKTEARIHPTQKPIALMEFLVKTYTNEYEIVLDATMGSGSTGVACVNTRRKFIGFETDKNFFAAAQKRLQAAERLHAQNLFIGAD
ncbi:MAG: site-specific DNA-methyltransferase [Selenomonadaceae bacterium]|nr:site-specific DNA-methyltransferase [Selenomonadaceae bacterium]MBR4383855.1 site-specific DNA-methyltransferase [Selenomonadaceae bacterium]